MSKNEEQLSSNSLPDDTEKRPDVDFASSKIISEIENLAKMKADLTKKEAEIECQEIIKIAEEEANKIKGETLNKAKNEAQNIKIREISRKKLAVKMDFLETREQIINEIIQEVKLRLQKFVKSSEYKNYLKKLILEGALSMGGGEIIIQLRDEDKSLLSNDLLNSIAKDISGELGQTTKFSISKDNLETIGGVKLVRNDGKLFIDNTLEKRLERSNDDNRIALLDLLK